MSFKRSISLIAGLSFLASCQSDEFTSSSAKNKVNPSTSELNQKAEKTADGSLSKPSENAAQAISLSFINQLLKESSLKFSPSSAELNFNLSHQLSPIKSSFTQIDRPIKMAEWTQGTPGTTVQENLTQNNFGTVDILVVVDSSGSMDAEQKNLGTKLSALLSAVKDASWRIAIISTDPDGNQGTCPRAIIDKSSKDAETTFKTVIDAIGIRGSGNERGILQAVNGLKDDKTCNPQFWVRPQGSVGVLIVSDEDNCSNGQGCGNHAYAESKFLTDHLASLRPDPVQRKVFGLIYRPSDDQATCSTGLNKGLIYTDAITKTSGRAGNICEADYAPFLRQVSEDLFQTLRSDYKLRGIPADGTLKVKVNNTDWNADVELKGQILTFKKLPPRNAMIEVTYAIGAIPMLKRFDPGSTIDPATLEVKIDANKIPSSDFAVDPNTNEIVFKTQPPELAKILAHFRDSSPLIKEFELGQPIAKTGSKVYVDGKILNAGYTVDHTKGLVSFDRAPADGAKIDIDAQLVGAPILNYPFKMADRQLIGIYSGNEIITPELINDEIKFTEAQFVDGKNIRVLWRSTAADANAIALPHKPINGQVTLKDGLGCEGGAFELREQTVICSQGLSASGELSYSYYEGENISFYPIARWPQAGFEQVRIEITVGNEPYTAFKPEPNGIKFESPLPPNTEVRISLLPGN